MTKPIADLDQRRLALDPGQSFIVQAPAGSGKTGLITQRILLLLARVQAPEEIVAITFTRKAAAEMRQRLLEALGSAERPLAADADDYTRQTWQLARAALDNDQAQGWHLLQNPARLRIQTIDSLCASLTRQLPILSRFGAQPATTDDAVGLYREAARATLADLEAGHDWSPSIAALLNHLDNNLATAERMLIAMLAKREQWLRHLVNVREPQWRALLESALADTVSASLQQLRAAFPPAAASDLMLLLDFASQRVEEGSPVFACRGLTALPEAKAEAMPQWLGICELLLTRENTWRQRIDKSVGFPAPSSTKDKAEKALYTERKEAITELVALLRQEPVLSEALAQLRSLPAPCYSDEQWQIVEAMCELLIVAVGHLRVVFGQRGEVDFSEVAQSALLALGDDDAPSDLALQLDYRIQHLLVDEFQDTSYGQFHLLQKLTAGWQAGDGRTLFVVGDPMQSIYRFREADVGLYLRARQRGIGGVVLQPLNLCVNFRSQAGGGEWGNQTFAEVLPAQEDVTIGAVTYAPSTAFHAAAGQAVHVHPFFAHDKQAEAEQVLALVQAALRQQADGSVAILVRARSHLVEITAALKQAGLRYRALEIEQLAQQPVVQDLYALTRALLHPADRLAWLAVLRAPWCGLSLADLLVLAEADIKAVLWSQLQSQLVTQMSAAGQARIARLRAVFAPAMQQRGRIALRRLLESVWLQLAGPACVDNETDLEDAEVFLALIDDLDQAGGIDDLALLDERLQRLFALPDIGADPRIQVMTIHKSKGLEFDTVILPALGRPAAQSDNPLLMWLERWSQHDQSELLLAPLRATGDTHDAIYRYLCSIDKRKSDYESGRLLYVAATRARKQLHLLGHVRCADQDGELAMKPPQSRSLLNMLWPGLEEVYQDAFARYTQSKPAQDQLNFGNLLPAANLRRLSIDWQPPAAVSAVPFARLQARAEDEGSIAFIWASDAARHVGSVVHALLQRIADDGVAAWSTQRIHDVQPYLRHALLREGVSTAEVDVALARTVQALNNTLADPRGQWLLQAHTQSRCEYAVSGVLDGRVVRAVMDRSFVDDDGVRWIIDYKTGSHEGGDVDAFLDAEQQRYQAQLHTYARLLRLTEAGPIRLALYLPLMQAWREWAFEG